MSEHLQNKIIIVEDNDFSRLVLTGMLKKAGYTNFAAPETSVEAWEMIAEAQLSDDHVDLVITDLNMPGMDGMDLISKIKEDPFSESIKVVVVSSDYEKTIIDITKTLGALAYITKPIVKEEFLAVIKAALLDEEIPEVKGMFPVPIVEEE